MSRNQQGPWGSAGTTGTNPVIQLLCGEFQEEIKGCPAAAQERKGGKPSRMMRLHSPAGAELLGCLQVGQAWILGMTCKHHISLEMAWIPDHILTPTVTQHSAKGYIFLLRT